MQEELRLARLPMALKLVTPRPQPLPGLPFPLAAPLPPLDFPLPGDDMNVGRKATEKIQLRCVFTKAKVQCCSEVFGMAALPICSL